jgi:hypothetical protein
MITIAKRFLFYLSIIMLSGCEFNPSEIPLNNVERPVLGAPVELKLNPDMDTLRIAQPIWIIYSVRAGSQEIYDIKIQLDTTVLSIVRDKDIRTLFDPQQVSDGWHTLNITVYTATNSGSIADKLKSEAFVYNINWPVYINNSGRDNLKFYPVVDCSAGIKLSWKDYRYADFKNYEIAWNSVQGSGSKKIYDSRQNYFIDSTLVEGCYSSYSLTYNFQNDGFSFDQIWAARKIIDPVVKVSGDGSVGITWNKSLNEKFVQLYCLKTEAPNYGDTEEHDISDLNVTSLGLSKKIGFGGDYTVRLRYIPLLYKSYHVALETQGGITSFALGDLIPAFDKSFYVSSENSYLLYKAGKFFKYNPQNGEKSVEQPSEAGTSTDVNMIASSPDGNYFGYFWNEKYVVRRTSDFSIVNTIDIQAYARHDLLLNDINISNNGIISTADYNNYVRLFNVASGAKIYETRYGSSYYTRESIISPDGQYLAVMFINYTTNKVELAYYNFTGDQLIELGRVQGVGADYSATIVYYPEAQHKIIIPHWISTYHYVIEVRDSRDFTLLSSSDVDFLFVPVAYDFASGLAIAQYQSFPPKKYSLLIDLNTGVARKIIQLTARSNYIFSDKKLYSGNGRSINVDNYIIN